QTLSSCNSMATGELSRTVRSFSRSEEHTSELQSRPHLVCRLLLEKKERTRIRRREVGRQGIRSYRQQPRSQAHPRLAASYQKKERRVFFLIKSHAPSSPPFPPPPRFR